MFKLSLKGMGINNAADYKISGEKHLLKLVFKQFSNPVVFDIGANRGTYTLECLKINPNCKIYSFEPHPENFNILKKQANKHKFIPVNLGVSSENKEFILYGSEKDDEGVFSSFHSEVLNDIYKEKPLEYKVQAIKVEDFIKEKGIDHVNLMKIDTEGHNLEVLKGAKNLIDNGKIDVIQFEFNEMNIISRSFLKDFIEILKNYCFYRLLPDEFLKIDYNKELSINAINPAVYEIFSYQNIIAIKKEIELC